MESRFKKTNFKESKMAEHHHFEKKLLNRHNSANGSRIAMKFAMKTHFDSHKPSDGQNLILKTRWWTADARTIRRSIYSKQLSKGQNQYSANADRVHIGAT